MDLREEKSLEMKLDDQLKVLFEELGRRYYGENTNKELEEGIYQDLFIKIDDIYNEKNRLEAKVLAKQGKRKCRKCQTLVILESRFCNMCGEKLEELPEDVVVFDESVKEKVCSKCGTKLESDAIFCPNCGQKNA